MKQRGLLKCLLAFGVLTLPLLLTACTHIRGHLRPADPVPATNAFHAGAARVDLTPPPGFPMGGHSKSGRMARGFWTRLHARAIYLRDAEGRGLALVACDLWSLPAGLADRVAERVRAAPFRLPLARDQIVLAATHTHQSPGNFSSCALYNDFASPEAGFDRRLFEFLAERIAGAIAAAVRAQAPARVLYGEQVVGMVARNRSFPAFVRDPESGTILQANAGLPTGPRLAEYPSLEAYHAVDPVLKVLRVESLGAPTRVIALAGFFSVHATAMCHTTEFYTSDLFGVATTLAEQRLAGDAWPAANGPVVALFNGAEGDISPAWAEQDRPNTLRLGARLAAGLTGLLSGGSVLEGGLSWRYTKVPLANVAFPGADGATLRTANHPLPGAPMLGGAEDGRTEFFTQGYIEGLTGPPTREHGPKLGALDLQYAGLAALKLGPIRITKCFVSKASVPRGVPVGLYQLGGPAGVTLATLPGEFTLAMGRRITEAVMAALPAGASRVVPVGLANEYVSYFTTPEEYAAQHYEGASMLYGPHAGTLVGWHLGSLARGFDAQGPAFAEHRFDYAVGGQESFGVTELKKRDLQAAETAVRAVVAGARARHFDWRDATPSLKPAPATDARLAPRVSIEAERGGQWVSARHEGVAETNEGLNFLTLVVVPGRTQSTWRAVWMPPAGLDDSPRYRFRVETLDGRIVCSEPFAL